MSTALSGEPTRLSPQSFQMLRTLPALRELGTTDRARVAALFQEVTLPRGTVVFQEGDAGRTLYVVVSGEVRVTSAGRVVAHLGPGEWFGEMSLITGASRSATVDVTLDCRLLALDAAAFARLLELHPPVYAQLAEILSRRLSRTSRGEGGVRTYEVVFVENAARWQDWRDVVAALADAAEEELGQAVAVLTVGTRAESAVQRPGHRDTVVAPAGARTRERVAAELASLGETVPLVLLVADDGVDAGSLGLGSLAGTALVLADGVEMPAGDTNGQRRIALHDRRRGTVPAFSSGTCAVLPRVARTRGPALRRLVRCLTRRTVGLALGSGAAYGLAHIGVLAVLEEAGVPIDFIAGASMGAIVGAGYSLGMAPSDLAAAARRFGSARSLVPILPSIVGMAIDLNFVRPGMFGGGRFLEFLSRFCPARDATFADLRIPFRAVATDVGSGARVEIGQGRLADALRASFSAPWIFTPTRLGERVLVDGGMADPVPAETARAMGADIVVAVNVIPSLDPSVRSPLDMLLGGLGRLNPLAFFDRRPAVHNSFDVVMKCLHIMQHELGNARAGEADVLVTPNLSAFWFLEFWAADPMIAEGARATEAVVSALRKKLASPAPRRA
jgi:NTE family protein